MERDELRQVDLTRLDRGYENQWELMEDLFAWLDLLLYHYYCKHQWLGPSSELRNMLGLVVSREEFEHNLARASQTGSAVPAGPGGAAGAAGGRDRRRPAGGADPAGAPPAPALPALRAGPLPAGLCGPGLRGAAGPEI